MKKLSVIVPVYNTEKYLKECIESVLSQTYKNLELILIDDGSTDTSGDMCDRFQNTHDNIKVVHKKNGGAADSRNCGLLAAEGEYIHFLDSDDKLILDNIYDEFNNIIDEFYPDIIFSRCATYSCDFSKKTQEQPAYETLAFFNGDLLFEVINKDYKLTLTSPVNKLFKKDFLLENNLFFMCGIDHEEDEWLPRVICKSKNAYFNNNLFYGARNNRPGSLSEINSEQVKTRKACSKIFIAHVGIDYMKKQSLPESTLSKVAGYYWDYLIDACVACNEIKDPHNKKIIFDCLKEHQEFFKSYKLLYSNNRRILGLIFRFLGVKIAVKTIGLRYR